jgi:hypothetical protein
VDAVFALRALLEAQKLEGKTEDRTRLIKQATAFGSEAMRPLSGSMIGEANRRLNAKEAAEERAVDEEVA